MGAEGEGSGKVGDRDADVNRLSSVGDTEKKATATVCGCLSTASKFVRALGMPWNTGAPQEPSSGYLRQREFLRQLSKCHPLSGG